MIRIINGYMGGVFWCEITCDIKREAPTSGITADILEKWKR
jgi:hypothetical protein